MYVIKHLNFTEILLPLPPKASKRTNEEKKERKKSFNLQRE